MKMPRWLMDDGTRAECWAALFMGFAIGELLHHGDNAGTFAILGTLWIAIAEIRKRTA